MNEQAAIKAMRYMQGRIDRLEAKVRILKDALTTILDETVVSNPGKITMEIPEDQYYKFLELVE